MHQRLIRTLVIATCLSGLKPVREAAAQTLAPAELARVEDWFRRTTAQRKAGKS